MREIRAEEIRDCLENLILKASYEIGEDIRAGIAKAVQIEASPAALDALEQIAKSYEIARADRVAICQDTGMTVVFLDVGQDLHILGDLNQNINEGVRRAYTQGYLRKSVVGEPLFERVNTGDNTPAIVHTRIVPGENISILVTPKGFGSENMSRVKMLVPADGVNGVIDFVVGAVISAGPNPCPPVVVGVGIGGTMEMAALIAKRMTARPINERHPDARYAALEEEILRRINASGIGAAGLGGLTTALSVNIDFAPSHIAGVPVAVNLCCHAARHAKAIL